jgi:hypothetical protein
MQSVLSEHLPLPRLLAAGLAASTTYAAPSAASSSKICDFLRKYGLRSLLVARLSGSACDGRPFGILINRRPLRLGARAFDVRLASIEESPAVISKGELLSRVRRTRPRQ